MKEYGLPHPVGLAEPTGNFNCSEPMDDKLTYDFMGDNARRMMGFSVLNPKDDAVALSA